MPLVTLQDEGTTVYNWTVLKNGSCCTVRPGKVSCLQKFRHFWMIIRDLFFESGSTEAPPILPSLVPIGPVVSEENIKIQKVNDGQMDDQW